MFEAAHDSEPRVDPTARTANPTPDASQPAVDVTSEAADLREGTVLKGCYRIVRRIGAGGMGTVYLAQHLEIEKRVAIKILGPESSHRPQLRERFLREARATASIDDEHVVAIHDFGTTSDGAVFFVMEYLQGVDLAALIQHHAPLPWPRARDIALQICGALAAAHAKGVIHRDMKPANVFRLDRSGPDFIKVLDFGIAKVVRPEQLSSDGLTHTGMLFGTPEYMSPEQAQGGRHDHRVDVYALGVILFEMLTGKLPFRADTFLGLLNLHSFEPAPRPSAVAPRADIPPAAEAVVLKALQKDPALRFQTMTEMADALVAASAGIAPIVVHESLRAARDRTTENLTRPRRRAWLALAGLGCAALTATVLATTLPLDEPAAQDLLIAVDEDPAPVGRPEQHVPAPPAPPAAPTVVLHFDTGNVAARVYDERDDLLGDTADPAGLVLLQGDDERLLSLRADGFQDLRLTVIPREDHTVPAPLVRARAARPGKPRPHLDPPPPQPAEPKPRTHSSPELWQPDFESR